MSFSLTLAWRPGQELVEAAVRVAAGDRLEGGGQVGGWLDAVHLGGLDQRGDAAPVPGTLVVTGEERVLACEDQRPDAVLDRVGVDLDRAVVDGQPFPRHLKAEI